MAGLGRKGDSRLHSVALHSDHQKPTLIAECSCSAATAYYWRYPRQDTLPSSVHIFTCDESQSRTNVTCFTVVHIRHRT
eukprot:scaffold422221_cov24-Prasinocladus_malaysianus.AAC.1